MRCYHCVLALALLCGLAALPGHASAAPRPTGVGDRAREIAGWDIVGQRRASLEELRGHWVLLDFWASWCGPCVRELPNLIAQTRPYRDRGELQLFSVCLDTSDGLKSLRKLIARNGLDYPVIYENAQFNCSAALDWGIDGVPSAFLINPQGVVVASDMRGPQLGAYLELFLHGTLPLQGLRSWHRLNADGSLSIFAEAYSPQRLPMELRLTRRWELWHPLAGESGAEPRADEIDRNLDRDFASARLDFATGAEQTWEFVLWPEPGMNILGYGLRYALPGTEGVRDAQLAAAPLWQRSGESQAIWRGIRWNEERGCYVLCTAPWELLTRE